MSSSQLVGTIADTTGTGVSGTLTIKLNAPLIDTSATPDKVYYPKPDVYAVTNGVLNTLNINLLRSDEVTYNFSFTYTVTTLILYLNGVEYTGAYHMDGGSYYTGEVHTGVGEQLLVPYNRPTQVNLFDPFDAHILESSGATVEWASLQPSNVNFSNIDTSLYYIAQLITQTSALLQSLVAGIYNPRGNYSAATSYSKGDVVYDPGTKGSYWYVFPTPSTGTPLTDTTHWQILITSTEVTGGSVDFSPVFLNTAYGAGWNGIVNKSPTADVLFDKIETLASLSNATFTVLKAPTQAVGTNTTDVATMQALQQALTAYTPPAPTTAPDIALTDVSSKIINSRILKRLLTRVAVAEERVSQGSNGGAIVGGFKNRNLNTMVVNLESTSVGLTSGYIQLSPGKYWVEGYSAVCGVDRNRCVLVDSSGNFLLLGTSEETGNRGYQLSYRGNNWGMVRGYIETSSTINITIRHYVETAGNSADSGKASNFAGSEIFAQLCVWKLSE